MEGWAKRGVCEVGMGVEKAKPREGGYNLELDGLQKEGKKTKRASASG